MMKLDRRNFIKLGAVGGGALALPDPLKLAEKDRSPWNRQQARCLRKFRNPRPTTCGLCDNHCGLVSFREGDRIVMLHGNPEHPVNQGKLCARAYGQLDRLYDPDRLLKPMLRKGKRGAGEWQEISWDQAYGIIAEKLTPLLADGGAGMALVLGRQEILSDRLRALFPGALTVVDGPEERLKRLRRRLYGVSGCRRDLGNSRFILNFAADPMIRGSRMLADSRGLLKARLDNGARLVSLGARLNNTAGRSDSWLPLRPEDYGTMARALAAHLLDKGLYSKKNLAGHGLNPAELEQVLSPYRPAQVADGLGLKASRIAELAEEMARRTPAVALYDDELLLAPDGLNSAAAVELLNLLLGAVNQPGGVYYFSEDDGLAAAVGRTVNSRETVSLDWFANWLSQRGNKPVVLSYAANPAYRTFSGRYPHALWRNPYKVPYHIAIDTHLSETSCFADLILPAATELESWGLADYPVDGLQRVLSLRQPVARIMDEILLLRQAKAQNLDLFRQKREPVAQSRDFNQIVLELSQVLKGEAASQAPRIGSWLEAELGGPAFQKAGISWTALQAQGFQTYEQKTQPALLRSSFSLAGFLPFIEIHENHASDHFTLVPYQWHVLDDLTANSRYLAEFRHDNPLWIHPNAAARLGLKEKDKVQVETGHGAVVARAWLTEAIHPGCVAIALGLGHSEIGRVARAQKIAQADPMTRSLLLHNPIHFTPFSFRLRSWDKVEPVWWYEKGNGVDIRRIFKAETDRQEAGMTTVETLVRLRKL